MQLDRGFAIQGSEYEVGVVPPPFSMVTLATSSQPNEERVCVWVSGFDPFDRAAAVAAYS